MDPKPYLVLARKYRPKNFDELIGQEAIATTLKNAISLKRIGHAYLFTGPRGVGKTSTARIFAKALNCAEGPTVTPCGKCSSCLEIDGGRALDVLEIDGASNRGIDEIRALRESVRFSPSSGKFKIYIIDEVHQITTDGFNALLKTLEEPPAHVKFIFATTSAQKVPATILSRCQRFDFRRISSERIAQALKEICKKEKIQADEEALFVIAKAADGSLRDSQTILDQIAASSDNKISKTQVIQSLGVLEEERLVEIMDALAEKDAAKALTVLDGLLKEGKDPALFLEKMLEHVRNLLFLHVSPELLDLVDATESYKKSLSNQKDILGREDLFYFFSVINHSIQTLRRFDMKRIPLEIALIKLAIRTPMQNISDLLEKVQFHPEQAKRVEGPKKHKPVGAGVSQDEEADPIEELPQGDVEVEPPAPREKSASLDSVWPALIQSIKIEKMSVASYLAEGEPGELKNSLATITFPSRLNFYKETLEVTDNRRLVEKHLSKLLNDPEIRVAFETLREITKDKPDPVAESKAAAPTAPPEENPAMKSAMNIFGGRVIQ